MMERRRCRARLAFIGAALALVGIGAASMAFGTNISSDEGLLPPQLEGLTPAPSEGQRANGPDQITHGRDSVESEAIPAPPGAASLAGPAASVVRRFAHDWANRNSVLTAATRREMVGLSAGAWAGAVFRQARLTLPAIEGVRAEGDLVMMQLTTVAPGSKTALVVTEERLLSPEGRASTPRYEIYLSRLDRVTPQGYAITAWEPQR